MAEAEQALQSWREAELRPIDSELLALAQSYVEAELKGREALGNRLGALITLAGALLALSVAAARDAAGAHLDGTSRTMFSVAFVGALVCLVGVLIVALSSIGPELRANPSPELLRHYGEHGITADEVREDAYKLSVAMLARLGPTNGRRARGVKRARLALILALFFAAAAAATVYFGTSWPTSNPHPTSHSPLPPRQALTAAPTRHPRPPRRRSRRSGKWTCARPTTDLGPRRARTTENAESHSDLRTWPILVV